MGSPDNILLHLSDDDEQRVRGVLALLEERGFPAQAQKPHVTITYSPVMPDYVVQGAAKLLPAGAARCLEAGRQRCVWDETQTDCGLAARNHR